MRMRHTALFVCVLAIVTAFSIYFVVASDHQRFQWDGVGSGGAQAKATKIIRLRTLPNEAVTSDLPPAAARPAATPLEPASTLAGVSVSALTSGLQADFNSLLSGDASVLSYDAATNAAGVISFLDNNRPRLQVVNVIPTLTSATLQANGSQLVTFTVQVTVIRGIWPTNLGTLTSVLNPNGTVTFAHDTLCMLASPLMEGCPF